MMRDTVLCLFTPYSAQPEWDLRGQESSAQRGPGILKASPSLCCIWDLAAGGRSVWTVLGPHNPLPELSFFRC